MCGQKQVDQVQKAVRPPLTEPGEYRCLCLAALRPTATPPKLLVSPAKRARGSTAECRVKRNVKHSVKEEHRRELKQRFSSAKLLVRAGNIGGG